MRVAVSGAHAFLGLERLDGILQFVPYGPEGVATRTFIIGGQETKIAARYVVSLDGAADAVAEWIQKGEDSSLGFWERQ
jgi:hypothetical protein